MLSIRWRLKTYKALLFEIIVVIILVLIVEFNNNNDFLGPVRLYGYYYENVSIFSTESNLDNLKDIISYIDLSEFSTRGIYDVDLKLNVHNSIYNYVIDSVKIKVEIK